MPSRHFGLLLPVALFISPWMLAGQENPSIPVQEIIQKFAAIERESERARATYSYRQDIRLQELDAQGNVRGEYHVVLAITTDPSGKRTEKTLEAPQNTLKQINLTKEDLQDIRDGGFSLASDDIQKYDINYLGKEDVNTVHCHTFDVKPKKIEKGQRYFQGKIWVEDRGFHIIKTYGKLTDIRQDTAENLFPRFETYRKKIGDYWFPSQIQAVDTLNFRTGDQRIREIVRFENYEK